MDKFPQQIAIVETTWHIVATLQLVESWCVNRVSASLAHTKLTQLRTQDFDSVVHTKLTQLCTHSLGGVGWG